MEGVHNISTNDVMAHKTNISDVLRELINCGYGKNNKIIKVNDLKKLKFQLNLIKVYNPTFDDEKNNNENIGKDENESD